MSERPVDRSISRRISILRTILIWGIVVIHIPPHWPKLEPFPVQNELFIWVKLFFEHTIFRSAVPTLSVISGYLLYRHMPRFQDLVERKTRSLLVPLILWNAPLVLILLALEAAGHGFSGLRADLSTPAGIVDALIGLTDQPVNFPLAFLRDLFVCAMLGPILLPALKRAPALTLLGVTAAALSGWTYPLVMRGDILVAFTFGGAVATRGWNVTALDRYWWAFGALFLAGCLHATWSLSQGVLPALPPDALKALGVLAFWTVSGVLVPTALGAALGRLSRYAFFTFAAHAPILFALRILEPELGLPYPVFYFLAPVVTIALAIAAYRVLQTVLPAGLSIITGHRAYLASGSQ